MKLHESLVRSVTKSPGRRVWTLPPPAGNASWSAIVLDAELYLDSVQAVPVLQQLQQAGSIPPLMGVFVSSKDAASRHSDYVCDSAYATFLAKDVVPWIRNHRTEGERHRIIVVGLSLSGLAAAHAALTFPDHFDAAICQSPSLW